MSSDILAPAQPADLSETNRPQDVAGEEHHTCYRCHVEKPLSQLKRNGKANSWECKECKRLRNRLYLLKPGVKARAAEYAKRKRAEYIERFDGCQEEIVQTCVRCGFNGLGRHFISNKAMPTGHNNICLACIRQRTRAYKSKNRPLVRAKSREYKIVNRDKVNAYARLYRTRPQIKIAQSLRASVNRELGGRKCSGRSLSLLGLVTFEDYKLYLESRFELGMNWSNYGNGVDKWNIDHIRPLFTFNLLDPKQAKKAFHFSNTRPMWQQENGSNGAIARSRKMRSNVG